jgi:hypothetical protein
MVNKEKQNKTEETKLGMAEPEEQARLPLSFYQKLLELPKCKIGEECDNCGRCEH